jgi:hypothetical protein
MVDVAVVPLAEVTGADVVKAPAANGVVFGPSFPQPNITSVIRDNNRPNNLLSFIISSLFCGETNYCT